MSPRLYRNMHGRILTPHPWLYPHMTIPPKLVAENPNCMEKQELLEMYGLKQCCHDTVRRWLIKLGFKYDYIRRNYYVDGHEKKETVRQQRHNAALRRR